jgi:hypothetical protein
MIIMFLKYDDFADMDIHKGGAIELQQVQECDATTVEVRR